MTAEKEKKVWRTTADGINVYCAYDKILDIDKVVENPRNPNTHPEKQVELLAKIIAEGWRRPITISKRSGYVVAGAGRLRAARELNLVEVPVEYQDYASEAVELAALLADNQISTYAELSKPMLKDILNDIVTGELKSLDLTGFFEEDIERLMTEIHQDETVEIENGGSDGARSGVSIEHLAFGKYRIEITDEECQGLGELLEAYLAKNSLTYGFVRFLLEGKSC
jgi:hypothetical protein